MKEERKESSVPGSARVWDWPFSRQFAEHLLLGQSYDWKLIVFLQLMVKLEESGQVSLLRLSLLALGPVGFRRREINWAGGSPPKRGSRNPFSPFLA